MKGNERRTVLCVEELESRALLAGLFPGFGFGGGGLLFSSNPTVQADAANVQAAQLKLQTDFVTLQPTLQADQAAIQTAIQTAFTTTPVETAQTALTTELGTARTTLLTDLTAVTSATTTAARTAAITQFYTDYAKLVPTIQADEQAVQTAINADPGVQAARAKLQTDAAPLVADQAALQADLLTLHADLQASGTTSGSGRFGFGLF